MPAPKEITDPDMHDGWKSAKKAAEAKVKAKAPYKALTDKFNLDLGPSLTNWAKAWPNYDEMKTRKTKIEAKVKKYRTFVKDAEKAKDLKLNLDKKVTSVLVAALDKIEEQLQVRLVMAESLLEQDPDLQVKVKLAQSEKEIKKPLRDFDVIRLNDISGEVMAKVPGGKDVFGLEKLAIQVRLEDKKLLDSIDDTDGNTIQKINSAANAQKLKDDVAKSYAKIVGAIKAGKLTDKTAKPMMEQTIEISIKSALERASAEAARLHGVKISYRNYKIISTLNLVKTGVGTVLAGSSVAMSPFTGPGVFVSLLGALNGLKSFAEQAHKLKMDAETLNKRVGNNIAKLKKAYEEKGKGSVTASELAKTAINDFFPASMKTINACADDTDQIASKVDGLEKKAGEMSSELNRALAGQREIQKEIAMWVKINKGRTTGPIVAHIKSLNKELNDTADGINVMLAKVMSMNERVDKARTDVADLQKQIAVLKGSESEYADLAKFCIGVTSNVFYLAAANVGWPEPYELTKPIKSVIDLAGNVTGSVQEAEKIVIKVAEKVEEANSETV